MGMGWLSRVVPAAAVAAMVSASIVPPAAAAGWKTVFEDQFDGPKLDRDRWATRYIYEAEQLDHLRDEAQLYRDSMNHVLKDGHLDLVARKFGSRYESGMIRSQQTFYYGYFEARVKLPSGVGIWPSFWLNSDYDINGMLSWPPEIDIFQFPVNGQEDTVNMVYSSVAAPENVAPEFTYTDPAYDPQFHTYRSETPLNDDWRVFGLAWTPEAITVFVDGKRLYTRKYQWLNPKGELAPPAHMILNFALGGGWAGRHGIDEHFPKTFSIDYVRVCQFEKGEGGDKLCGGSELTPDPAEYGYEAPFGDMAKPAFRCVDLKPGGPTCVTEASWKDELQITSELAVPEGGLGPRFVVTRLQSLARPALMSIVGMIEISPEEAATRRLVEQKITVPAKLPPGDYAIVQSLALPDPTRPDGLGLPTPIRCDTSEHEAPKTLLCQIGEMRVLRR